MNSHEREPVMRSINVFSVKSWNQLLNKHSCYRWSKACVWQPYYLVDCFFSSCHLAIKYTQNQIRLYQWVMDVSQTTIILRVILILSPRGVYNQIWMMGMFVLRFRFWFFYCRDKMAAVLMVAFKDKFSSEIGRTIWLKFDWNLFLGGQLAGTQFCIDLCNFLEPNRQQAIVLTHWGRVTHICVSKLTSIGSDSGLSPGRRQAIIWTNAWILLIGPLGTNVSEILIEIIIFSFMKMCLKVSSAKWRPFCLGLNVLINRRCPCLRRHVCIIGAINWCLLVPHICVVESGQHWFR